ncbi:hypothetical protein P153DRAFT_296691, partial [Dothidotthia symphoricarpi CBS 119687]
ALFLPIAKFKVNLIISASIGVLLFLVTKGYKPCAGLEPLTPTTAALGLA